jgi:O-antigen/teichoic acid export membrane protein
MDRFIVGIVVGPAAVSLVEIAAQVQAGADAVLSASAYAVAPSAAWLSARGDRRNLADLMTTGTRYVLLATLPVVALSAVLAGPAIRLWVGASYAEAAGLASIGVVTIGVLATVHVGSNLLLGIGRATDVLRAVVVAIVVNLVGSLVLVHAVGTVGPLQATLISTLITVPLIGSSALRAVHQPPGAFLRLAVLPAVIPSLIGAGVAGVVLLAPLGDLQTVLAGGVGGIAAITAATLRWGISPDELRGLFSAVSRRTPVPDVAVDDR